MPLKTDHGNLEVTPLNEKAYCVVAVKPYLSTGKQDPESIAIGITYDPSSMARIIVNKDQAVELLDGLKGLLESPEAKFEYCVARRPDANSAHEVYFSAPTQNREDAEDQAAQLNGHGVGKFFVKKRPVGEWVEA